MMSARLVVVPVIPLVVSALSVFSLVLCACSDMIARYRAAGAPDAHVYSRVKTTDFLPPCP